MKLLLIPTKIKEIIYNIYNYINYLFKYSFNCIKYYTIKFLYGNYYIPIYKHIDKPINIIYENNFCNNNLNMINNAYYKGTLNNKVCGDTLLTIMIRDNDIDAIKLLLSYNVNTSITKYGLSPFIYAVSCDNYDIIKLLIDHNIKENDIETLQYNIKSNKIRLLLQQYKYI